MATPVCFVDRLDTLSFVERHGVIRSMTRKARVIFPYQPPTDFSVLSEALTAPNMPAPMSTLANLGYESLVLVERSPAVAELDPGVVDVVLKYEHILDGPNQELISPPSGFLFGKGRCSITEKTTNFFRPYGDPFADRVQILTAHTFALTDPQTTGTFLGQQFPNTLLQGGEVSIPFPQANFQVNGIIDTDNPWAIADAFIACVNSGTWLNKPPLTWICSEVQWDLIGDNPDFLGGLLVGIYRYKFSFEFQYNIDTWYPTVVFNDQRTGRPPASVEVATAPTTYTVAATGNSYGVLNLAVNSLNPSRTGPNPFNPNVQILLPNLQPAGYWTVPILRQVDFNRLFSSFFEAPPIVQ